MPTWWKHATQSPRHTRTQRPESPDGASEACWYCYCYCYWYWYWYCLYHCYGTFMQVALLRVLLSEIIWPGSQLVYEYCTCTGPIGYSDSAGKPKFFSLYPMIFSIRSFLGTKNGHRSRIINLTGVTVTNRACIDMRCLGYWWRRWDPETLEVLRPGPEQEGPWQVGQVQLPPHPGRH